MSDNGAASGPATTVDFGFRSVKSDEKAGLVRAVFDRVAPRYDLMNDLMSLGVHRLWKRIFITDLRPSPRDTLLDLAGGTGDISLGWLQRGGGPVLLTDINSPMLSIGRDRALERGFAGDITLVVADAEKLPFPDRCVDRVSIAFGLRNCTDKHAVLCEARRVLKPGGRFVCLEFSRVNVVALAAIYDAWSFQVLPRLGRRVAARRGQLPILGREYPHLPRSAGPGHDAEGGRAGSGQCPQSVRWHRCDPFGLAAVMRVAE